VSSVSGGVGGEWVVPIRGQPCDLEDTVVVNFAPDETALQLTAQRESTEETENAAQNTKRRH